MDLPKTIPERFADKFYFYEGTETIDEMNENLKKLGLGKSKGYYIHLENQFYAVFFGGYDKQIVIGKEKVFFSRNGRLVESSIGEANIQFEVNGKEIREITNTLARELHLLFDPIDIYEYPAVNSREYRKADECVQLSNYVVLLGVTFASRFYTLNHAEEMSPYFIHTPELISFLRRTKGAIAIDPFSQLIQFKDGKIGTYSYKRTSRNRYHRNHYHDNGFQHETIFALEEKNTYSPFRKREWMSMTRYQFLYPHDNIQYSVPDYRSNKHTCKWCGNTLVNKRRSYCSDDCRFAFEEAVHFERGASLPYIIMCRDQFTCQTCGKDMAQINEHGMKLPIPRLYEKPDKDGVCRSEAEVDHIVAVEDGGSDHQSNLSTICQDCHKKKHKKRKTKAERKETQSNVIVLAERKKTTDQKKTSPPPNQHVLMATDKQLSYLDNLARNSGLRVINHLQMERSEASKLINFFVRKSRIDPTLAMKYLIKY